MSKTPLSKPNRYRLHTLFRGWGVSRNSAAAVIAAGEEVVIRKAMVQDLREMARLLEQLFAIEKDFHFDYCKQLYGLQLLYNDQTSQLFVARYRNRVIGMVTLQEVVSTAQGGLAGLLEDLIVDETYRGMGIGRRLLEAVREHARRNSYVRIQLAADRTNKSALAFYKKEGFAATRLGIYHTLRG